MTPPDPPVLLFAANSAWNIRNYRIGLLRFLLKRGYRVAIAAPPDAHLESLQEEGVEIHPLPMQARGTSPIADLMLLARFRQMLKRMKPTALLGFTIKPNIFGSIASRGLDIAVINNVSGLGSLFVRETLLSTIASRLYRIALRDSSTVFFQNPDDAELFQARKLVRPEQIDLLPGSGIDLNRFAATPLPNDSVTFLLAARLLRDKGIVEFVEAARLVRGEVPGVKFEILGNVEEAGAAAIQRRELEEWNREGCVTWLGGTTDVRPYMAASSCVVLPSYYREGVPRILLEAAAMGRPVITTDMPGCREAVIDGVSGYVCEARSSASLADAMTKFAKLDVERRRQMGLAGRNLAERSFDETIVHQRYVAALDRAGVAPPVTLNR